MPFEFSISLVFFFFILFLAISFFIYTIFIKIKQSTYTDKRFHFVAFSASVSIFILALTIVAGDSHMAPILAYILSGHKMTFAEKFLVLLFSLLFLIVSSYWARGWTGLSTSTIQATDRPRLYFFTDGVKELLRIVRRQPPIPAILQMKKSRFAELRLLEPLAQLSLEEQVRELALAKWPEYQLDVSSWSGEAHCWTGSDKLTNATFILVVAQNETALDLERTSEHIAHFVKKGKVRIAIVFAEILNKDDSDKLVLNLAEISSNLGRDNLLYTFEFFIRSALPLHRYEATIKKQFESFPIINSNISLKDTYVESKITNENLRIVPATVERIPSGIRNELKNWLAETSGRQLAILGDYGQGKSSEALAITYSMLFQESEIEKEHRRIPILIKLTGLSPNTMTPAGLLGAWGAPYSLGGQALLALHQAGKTLIIFDAFDEMSGVADRGDRFEHFTTLWRFACPNAKIIFTGRPNFFLDDNELKNALLISNGSSATAFCSAIRLAPFDEGQISEALRWLSFEKREAFIGAMAKSTQLRELARRPSLLFQIAQLWNHDRLNIDDHTLNSSQIIRNFIEYSLERQIAKQKSEAPVGGTDKNFVFLRMSELYTFTVACAVGALTGGRNNSISGEQIQICVETELACIQKLDMPRRAVEDGSLLMPLNERLADKLHPGETCAHAVRTHGVLEHDPSLNSYFKFSHKSFAEVLAAEKVISQILGKDITEPLSDSKFLELLNQDIIFFFVIEMLAEAKTKNELPSDSRILKQIFGNKYFVILFAYRLIIISGQLFNNIDRLFTYFHKINLRLFKKTKDRYFKLAMQFEKNSSDQEEINKKWERLIKKIEDFTKIWVPLTASAIGILTFTIERQLSEKFNNVMLASVADIWLGPVVALGLFIIWYYLLLTNSNKVSNKNLAVIFVMLYVVDLIRKGKFKMDSESIEFTDSKSSVSILNSFARHKLLNGKFKSDNDSVKY